MGVMERLLTAGAEEGGSAPSASPFRRKAWGPRRKACSRGAHGSDRDRRASALERVECLVDVRCHGGRLGMDGSIVRRGGGLREADLHRALCWWPTRGLCQMHVYARGIISEAVA
jgi:hypothetical protein